jgi:tRNA-binding protein
MKDLVTYSEFRKVDIRVGTIISAEINNKLMKPSFILKIDFGTKIGIKKSSAQVTKNYTSKKLLNKQIAAVLNFKPKQIGNLISEVLVLGFPDDSNEPILISPNKKVSNGCKLY